MYSRAVVSHNPVILFFRGVRNYAKLSIGYLEERLSLATRCSSFHVGTVEGLLAEDGLVATEEGVVVCCNHISFLVSNGNTDVEDATFCGHVSIVPVRPVGAVKALGGFGSQNVQVTSRELVGGAGGGQGDQGQQSHKYLHLSEIVQMRFMRGNTMH